MIDADVLALPFEAYLARIRAFTDGELIPGERAMTELGAVPPALVAHMASLGLFGITLPRTWGGLGWTMEEQVRLTFEFTRASCVYRSRFSTTIGLASQVILDHGTPSQRERYLRRMAAGECVGAFALTEVDAGSDASNVATRAELVGGGYIINGSKRYITNGAWADLVLVFAQAEGGLSTFLVDAPAEGLHATLPSRMNGHEAGPVAELRFDDLRLGVEALLGGREGEGLRQAMRGINHARTHVAATSVGQATRLLAEATRHALNRRQFGSRLADFGMIEAMLGQSYAEIEAGRALVLECARAFDAGDIPRHRIAAAKYYCSEMVGRVADRAVQILGGEGIVGDHPVPRMWRDVRTFRIYEGASQVHERNLANHVKDVFG